MSFYDVTPNKPPLLTPEEAAGLQGHAWPEPQAPFDWVGKVEPHPFKGLPYIIAAVVLPWLLLGLWYIL